MWKKIHQYYHSESGRVQYKKFEQENKQLYKELSLPEASSQTPITKKAKENQNIPIENKIQTQVQQIITLKMRQQMKKSIRSSRQIFQEVLYSLTSENKPRIRNALVSLQRALAKNLGQNSLNDKLVFMNIIQRLISLDNSMLDSDFVVLECLTLFWVNDPNVFVEAMQKLLVSEDLDQYQILLLLSAVHKGMLVIYSTDDLSTFFRIFIRADLTQNSLMFGNPWPT